MKIIKDNMNVSFKYNGENVWNIINNKSVCEDREQIIFEYVIDGGLRVINIAKKYPDYDACEWVTWFENTGDAPSGIISELNDCDVDIPSDRDENYKKTGLVPNAENEMKIYAPTGSNWSKDEFGCDADKFEVERFINHIYPG